MVAGTSDLPEHSSNKHYSGKDFHNHMISIPKTFRMIMELTGMVWYRMILR